ncbi:MAG TPA: DUF4097 family beta strand repeat-containing protein [Acidimicrobiales bacterium]|jgi:DUF4097 and DUF4098 domain-containing protein YvlB|nr:DUF4097 family beta strand repeat-containing protein [Acidimicrobiales bacterium]
MPTFTTPSPIAVTIELGIGDIQLVAGDRTDTVVEVRPSDPAKREDVTAAERMRVEYTDGRLLIKGIRAWKQYTFKGGRESIDVLIHLPAGSDVHGEGGLTALRATGRLGTCRYKNGIGDIRVERAGTVDLRTGSGDISVDHADGRAEVTTASGAVRIGSVDGAAVIKNSNGDTRIGGVTGDLRVNAANGTIAVDRAQAGVEAKTANGDVRLGELVGGTAVVHTAYGQIDVGIRQGVTAWLDLVTGFGTVRNNLESANGPASGEDAVEVRARTGFGDITIHRSPADDRVGAA